MVFESLGKRQWMLLFPQCCNLTCCELHRQTVTSVSSFHFHTSRKPMGNTSCLWPTHQDIFFFFSFLLSLFFFCALIFLHLTYPAVPLFFFALTLLCP